MSLDALEKESWAGAIHNGWLKKEVHVPAHRPDNDVMLSVALKSSASEGQTE